MLFYCSDPFDLFFLLPTPADRAFFQYDEVAANTRMKWSPTSHKQRSYPLLHASTRTSPCPVAAISPDVHPCRHSTDGFPKEHHPNPAGLRARRASKLPLNIWPPNGHHPNLADSTAGLHFTTHFVCFRCLKRRVVEPIN
jgi:hypothetical protein